MITKPPYRVHSYRVGFFIIFSYSYGKMYTQSSCRRRSLPYRYTYRTPCYQGIRYIFCPIF